MGSGINVKKGWVGQVPHIPCKVHQVRFSCRAMKTPVIILIYPVLTPDDKLEVTQISWR